MGIQVVLIFASTDEAWDNISMRAFSVVLDYVKTEAKDRVIIIAQIICTDRRPS